MAIFGYMNLMIFAKWFKFDSTDASCAPSILINLINMFLYKYVDDNDKSQPCYLHNWYSGQKFFQTILLLAALTCVPWMLVIKPYILKKQNDLRERFHPRNEVIVDGEVGGDTTLTIEPGQSKAFITFIVLVSPKSMIQFLIIKLGIFYSNLLVIFYKLIDLYLINGLILL